MTPERWAQIDRIHAAAIDRPMAERAAFLDEACAGDPSLRREVESLLAYASAAETFLDQPAVQRAAGEFEANEPIASDVLPIVPGYSVLEVLGAGGMGIVYLAEQDPPLRRRVALKLIRPGLDSKSALARFEAERRALALMDHPNIAAVFGTGVAADGRPFVAMELVAGVPITEYCDRLRLSVRARLDLFGKVCAGVQHAHQKGVIHRDLKPSNVLVTEQDDRPVPKVIDFGTATLADRPTARGLGLTEAGTVVGTLEYMSPEQAALSADIDTASDVYSLGVLLYELLVGKVPFDRRQLQAAGYDEMRRVIQESDPPRPSSHLAGGELAANEISDARASDVGRLARELTGDLDWIVLRALEKDRRRRYSTVAAFAADIERFLTDQAIEARPPSAAYRVGKFARRHRGAVSAAAALIGVLVAGLVASTSLYFRAERERERASEALHGLSIYNSNASFERARAYYLTTIAAAEADLRADQPHAARERLLTLPVGARGAWEWQHLFLKTDTSLMALAGAPCDPQTSNMPVQSRPLTDRLVLADGGTRIDWIRCNVLDQWDTGAYAHAASVSPPGTRFFDANSAGLRLAVSKHRLSGWNLQLSGRPDNVPEITFGPFEKEPACASISADGGRIGVGFKPPNSPLGENLDDVFEIWSTATGRLVVRLHPQRATLTDTRLPVSSCVIRFGPDGSRVATSGATVHVWATESGVELRGDTGQAGIVAQPVAFSPDGASLAVGRNNGLVDVIGLGSTANLITRLDGNGIIVPLPLPAGMRPILTTYRRENEVWSVAFSPDGTRIVSAFSSRIGVWDVRQRKLVKVLVGHLAPVVSVIVGADDRFIVSGDSNGYLRLWASNATEPPSEAGVTRLPGSSLHNADVVLRQDGRTAAVAGKDTALGIWRLDDFSQVVLRTGTGQLDLQNSFHPIGLTPDGRYLLTAGGGPNTAGTVRRWTIATGESITVGMADPRAPACDDARQGEVDSQMVLSDDGRYLAFGDGLCVLVRDLTAMTSVASLNLRVGTENQIDIGAIRFRPDGVLVVSSGHSQGQSFRKVVRIWDWRSRGVIRTVEQLSGPDDVPTSWNVVISPNGSRIALVGDGVWIWDGGLIEEFGRLPVRGSPKVAFSTYAARIASVTSDPMVRVWDTDRLAQVLALKDTEGHSFGVAFTPDGRLIAGRTSGGFTIWESKKASCAACERHLASQPLPNKPVPKALDARGRADIQMLESTDCRAGDLVVPSQSERVFVLNPRRACWTPWLVFGEADDPIANPIDSPNGGFDLDETGDVLVELGFSDGTISKAFRDGPDLMFDPEKKVHKIRFKSLGKGPVTITFKPW